MRQDIKNWIASVVHIGAWDIEFPTEQPTLPGGVVNSHAVLFPFQNTAMTFADGTMSATADVNVTIKYVFDGDVEYDQLPLDKLERVLTVLNARAVLERPGGVRDLTVNLLEFPLTVERIEEDGVWACALNLSWRVSYTVRTTDLDPSYGLPSDDIAVSRFTLKTFNDERLDMEWTLTLLDTQNP
jgi:hypothetical protein